MVETGGICEHPPVSVNSVGLKCNGGVYKCSFIPNAPSVRRGVFVNASVCNVIESESPEKQMRVGTFSNTPKSSN